ncbi:MAG: glycerophosphodiester phosphodiesterase [Bacteroidetes bacterium]|nr:glycerophosphodiester phosphodiesterase [Bacteroidota bacterium]MCH8031204.1 glycerophosphodiester phosphodiesterase [Bacteroidota bacterium]
MISPFDIQGHRGARGLAPENTLPAFKVALELGVTTLELDTVISADHEVVVSHDPWFSSQICSKPDGEPVTPEEEQEHLIYQIPYAEVARFDCGKRGHPDFPRQQPQAAVKPLLQDVIAFSESYAQEHGRPPARYNVETKSLPDGDGRLHPAPEAFVELIWNVVEETGIAGRFILQSFDARTLREARVRALPIQLALLISPGFHTPKGHLRKGLEDLGFTPDIYSPDFHLVTENVVEMAHNQGILVIPWTVNDAEDMLRLREMGVDGLITDYPDVAIGELG